MNLINIKVSHKAFGEGIITDNSNNYILVKFKDDEKRFVYPDAFDGYLVAKDNNINENIKQIIEFNKKIRAQQHVVIQQKEIKTIKNHKNIKNKIKDDYPRRNIAFKCNFCDGGKSDKQVGFDGICSDEIMKDNIKVKKHVWCSSDDCACNQYLNGDISLSYLKGSYTGEEYACYESQMLRNWRAFAGIVQTGERKGQPMKLNKVKNNSLCILTTRDPNSAESERYIFGLFLVDETYSGDNKEEGYVTTKSKYRIKFSSEEAHKMLFWNYHANVNQPKVAVWSSGLHRYFEDEQAIQILQDTAKLKKGTNEEDLANEFLLYFAKINNIDINMVNKKSGALQI